ncbi:MAG TPA: DoxX family protein [Pseudonocardiaceae bacterium]|jgi:putative oxidoreductase|nr:DoxX family protein [Pseudonocardiaceae bacterium]
MNDSAGTGLLILRVVIMVIMGFHGTQKLFGWWDGGGLDQAERFFASQGFRPPRLMGAIAGLTETVGAVLIGAGALTVLGVAMLVGVLITVLTLHAANGLDARKHGFEPELMIVSGVIAIGLCGPGAWSVDSLLALPTWTWLGPVAIVVGLAAGLVVSATRRRTVEVRHQGA